MTAPRSPIAYLTGQYPKVSHTFIQREIEGLRALGWTVHACTVRRAPAKDVVGPARPRRPIPSPSRRPPNAPRRWWARRSRRCARRRKRGGAPRGSRGRPARPG